MPTVAPGCKVSEQLEMSSLCTTIVKLSFFSALPLTLQPQTVSLETRRRERIARSDSLHRG